MPAFIECCHCEIESVPSIIYRVLIKYRPDVNIDYGHLSGFIFKT